MPGWLLLTCHACVVTKFIKEIVHLRLLVAQVTAHLRHSLKILSVCVCIKLCGFAWLPHLELIKLRLMASSLLVLIIAHALALMLLKETLIRLWILLSKVAPIGWLPIIDIHSLIRLIITLAWLAEHILSKVFALDLSIDF